jgi:hypothetical protein
VFRRVYLFARDYFSEFGIAWSLARMHDCERNGGHRWGDVQPDETMGRGQTCSRCGTFRGVTKTSGTAVTNTPLSVQMRTK